MNPSPSTPSIFLWALPYIQEIVCAVQKHSFFCFFQCSVHYSHLIYRSPFNFLATPIQVAFSFIYFRHPQRELLHLQLPLPMLYISFSTLSFYNGGALPPDNSLNQDQFIVTLIFVCIQRFCYVLINNPNQITLFGLLFHFRASLHFFIQKNSRIRPYTIDLLTNQLSQYINCILVCILQYIHFYIMNPWNTSQGQPHPFLYIG